MDLALAGRRAAVAAASTGLGRATADALLAEGARVAVCSHDRAKIEATRAELGPEAIALVADLRDWAAGAGFVREATEALGGLDILVVNHPGPPVTAATDLTEAAVRDALEAGLLVSLGMILTALPGMRAQGFGRIVVISSLSAREPIPGLALSTLSRAGLTAYLKSLADEVAADGVTVNSVQAGYHRTARVTEDVAARVSEAIPARRLGDPAELGATVAFLCSAQAAYLTGVSVPADGGQHRAV